MSSKERAEVATRIVRSKTYSICKIVTFSLCLSAKIPQAFLWRNSETLFYKGCLMREVDNEDDLSDILRGSKKVFVVFYASWCPFCRSFLPIFEKYARVKDCDKFLRVRIDDETNPLWEKYGVEVVPTVLFFKGERVFRRLNGMLGVGLSEKQLKDFLESA